MVADLQNKYPSYASNFPLWSLEASGILQYNVWLMLEDSSLGASLQHYNPLIDEEVAKEWNIPKSWKLISEMPFGVGLGEPSEKEFSPIENRVLVFK